MPVNSMVASGAPLFGVRLIFRRGLGEGRQRGARGLDAKESGIGGEVAAEAPGVGELRHEANVGQRRRGAEREPAAPRRARHLLQRAEAEADPVSGPAVGSLVALLEIAF